MKLANGYDLMDYAKRNGYILPAFNTINMEMTYVIELSLQSVDNVAAVAKNLVTIINS